MSNALTIGVVGGGLMGHGIAYLLAAGGHKVGIYEPTADVRASLPQRLRSIVDLLGSDAAILDRIATHERLEDAVGAASFGFEAAPEKLELKQRIFAELLLARMASGATSASSSPKMRCLSSSFSGAASNTNAAPATPSTSRSCDAMRSRIAASDPSRSTIERSRCGSEARTSEDGS